MGAAPPECENRQLPRAGWAVFAVLLAGIGYAFMSVHHIKETKLQGYPLVVADPSKLDFGERWEGEKFEWTIPIRNTSSSAIRLPSLHTSCTCARLSKGDLLFRPGETVDVLFEIETPLLESRNSLRQIHRVVVADEGEAGRPRFFQAYLTGAIDRLLKRSPSRLSFSHLLLRGVPTLSEAMQLSPVIPLQELRVEGHPGITPRVERLPGGDYSLSVRYISERVGKFDSQLSITGIGEAGKVVGRSRVGVSGEVEELVCAQPNDHHFGVMSVGTTKCIVVSIESRVQEHVRIVAWKVINGNVKVSPVGDSERGSYRLSFSCDRAGEQEARVRFDTLIGNADRVEIGVVVRAYGIRP